MSSEDFYMSRKDFISDRLVDMRAQLRDSYTSYHQEKAARNAAAETKNNVPEAKPVSEENKVSAVDISAAGTVQNESAAKKVLPTLNVSSGNSAFDREWRDLEGRVLHDIAELESEKMLLQQKMLELEKFSEVLRKTQQNLYTGELTEIRLAYFSSSGRWNSFVSRGVSANSENASRDDHGAYWVAGSILAAGIIMALTMVGLFT